MAYHYLYVSSYKLDLYVRYLQLVPVLIWEALIASNLLTLEREMERRRLRGERRRRSESNPAHLMLGMIIVSWP